MQRATVPVGGFTPGVAHPADWRKSAGGRYWTGVVDGAGGVGWLDRFVSGSGTILDAAKATPATSGPSKSNFVA